MRTTLDIDEDVLQAAKERAASEKKTAGQILSELARKALTPTRTSGEEEEVRHGVPLLPPKPDARIVTPQTVQELHEDEA
jgi:hypothetical protein